LNLRGTFVIWEFEKTIENLFEPKSIASFGKKNGKFTVNLNRYRTPNGTKEDFKMLNFFWYTLSAVSKS
jgi:hypothetical protein